MSVRLLIPEIVVPGKRLGRHLHHDPRSLRYVVPAAASPVVAEHEEKIGILDQGDLGSCTGNAFTGMLGTAGFFEELPKGTTLDEAFAVQRYSRATQVDNYRGTYKPTDTGSDGLSVCKAGQADGFVSGYTHATSLAGCFTMIGVAAFIIGISWYEGMDEPDAHGNVEIAGQVRGGHEVTVVARQADGRWRVKNSWADTWGDQGHFYVSDAQLTQLLAESGDATQGVPISVAPPTPPEPGENAFPAAEYEDFREAYKTLLPHPYSKPKEQALLAAAGKFVTAADTYMQRAE